MTDKAIQALQALVRRHDLDAKSEDESLLLCVFDALEQQRVPEGLSDLWSVEWHRRDNGQFEATIWPDPENPRGGLGDTPMDAVRDALAAEPEQ